MTRVWGSSLKYVDGVGLVDIGPVAQADEGADPQLFLGGPVHEGRAHGAALGDEGHAAPGW